ncbi:hypothetical protein B0H14DRAFT_1131057 [Mycena olivaceomarginata]|nr:hypothetical protein B0H14DRAFT_1131057 [Mycena olivaceomarginata]
MTARFDGLESIIGWFVVCGSKIESELLHDSIELSILISPQLARAHTRPLFSLILCALLDQTSIIAELNQAAWTPTHLSRPTRWRPTCRVMVRPKSSWSVSSTSPDRADRCQKMILIKGWDVTEATLRNKHQSKLVKGRVQYHVTQFKIPGGVLNILDLTSIITSKGAMVLCACVALMCAVCLSTTDLAYYCYEVAGNVPKFRLTRVYFGLKWSFSRCQ